MKKKKKWKKKKKRKKKRKNHNFGNSYVLLLTHVTKRLLIFLEFPMKNISKIFVIPTSSLGSVHLISDVNHWQYNIATANFHQASHFASQVTHLSNFWERSTILKIS